MGRQKLRPLVFNFLGFVDLFLAKKCSSHCQWESTNFNYSTNQASAQFVVLQYARSQLVVFNFQCFVDLFLAKKCSSRCQWEFSNSKNQLQPAQTKRTPNSHGIHSVVLNVQYARSNFTVVESDIKEKVVSSVPKTKIQFFKRSCLRNSKYLHYSVKLNFLTSEVLDYFFKPKLLFFHPPFSVFLNVLEKDSLGTIHLRRRHGLGGEGSKIQENLPTS